MGLTVKKVARLTKPGRYRDSLGLYLVVKNASNRNWTLRYQLRGKEHWMGLGSVAIFSLPQARQWRDAARRLLADKIDPLEVRRAEQAKQALEAARLRLRADEGKAPLARQRSQYRRVAEVGPRLHKPRPFLQ